jgi:hypothetical protein
VFRRDQFPNNTIPLNRFDSAALKALDRFPIPNVFSGSIEATANNYRRTGTEQQYQDQFDVRVDHQLTPTQRVFGRYSYLRDDSRPVAPLPDGSGTITTGVIGNTLTRADGVVAEHSWTISPGSLNQVRFGYTRRGFNRDALRLGIPASQASGVPNIPAEYLFPIRSRFIRSRAFSRSVLPQTRIQNSQLGRRSSLIPFRLKGAATV